MVSLLILVSWATSSVGPLDAFQANLSEAKAHITFECNYYEVDNLMEIEKRLRSFAPDYVLSEEPTYMLEGLWEYDGTAEHYVVRETGGSRWDPEGKRGAVLSNELIADETLSAYHPLSPGPSDLYVNLRLSPARPISLVAPFSWYSSDQIDEDLSVNYGSGPLLRKTHAIGPHPLEVEVYRRTNDGIDIRREVWFDPNQGYLPKFVRAIAFGEVKGQSTASVKEWYLLNAATIRTGAFVPTEWVLAQYSVDSFASQYPAYDETTGLTPSGPITLVHFKVTQLEDQTTPVRLEHLADVKTILAPGGPLPLGAGRQTLTVAELKSLLGPKLAPPRQPPPAASIDVAELQEFAPRLRSRSVFPYVVGGVGAILVLIALAILWKRRGSAAPDASPTGPR